MGLRSLMRRAMLVTAIGLGLLLSAQSSAFAASPLNMYRFYNVNGSHFFTCSEDEYLTLIRTPSLGYNYEGIGWTSDAASPAHTQSLHRFLNVTNGTHFYTASEQEKAYVLATWPSIFQYEGVSCYVNSTAAAGTIPVYRFYFKRLGSHFYTTSLTEANNIILYASASYTYDGIGFWITPTSPGPVPDDDRASYSMGVEWVGAYVGTGAPAAAWGDLQTPQSCVEGLYAIVNDSSTPWLWKFNWGNSSAWELDWKRSGLGGNAYRVCDDVDLVAWAGHGVPEGYPPAIQFSTYKNDWTSTPSEMDLGYRDCEWALMYTCRFLRGSPSDFGSAANGVHLICGYCTDMTMTANGGQIFAYYAKPYLTRQAYGVRVAWYKYGQSTQEGVWANTARTFGSQAAVNDYLWGYGAVAADPPAYSTSTASLYSYWDTNLGF